MSVVIIMIMMIMMMVIMVIMLMTMMMMVEVVMMMAIITIMTLIMMMTRIPHAHDLGHVQLQPHVRGGVRAHVGAAFNVINPLSYHYHHVTLAGHRWFVAMVQFSIRLTP